jgi:hypothetical protein
MGPLNEVLNNDLRLSLQYSSTSFVKFPISDGIVPVRPVFPNDLRLLNIKYSRLRNGNCPISGGIDPLRRVLFVNMLCYI